MQKNPTDEATRFLSSTEKEPLYIAYLLAIFTGMRMGEILGLRWQAVDFENKTLSIQQSLAKTKNGLIFQEPKSKGSKRLISITDDVVQALKKHKLEQSKQKLQLGMSYGDFDLVVCTSLGTPMIPENLRRHYNRMISECGIKKIRFHDLRHTHASIMLQLGEHPKVVSERLGHSRTSVTLEIYSHVIPGIQEKAAEKFSHALSKKG
nr:site-specific integrase [Thermoactinomyces sp. DSM 45891]